VVVAEKTNGAHGAPEQKTVMGGALPPHSDVRVENANISFMRMRKRGLLARGCAVPNRDVFDGQHTCVVGVSPLECRR